MRGNLGRVALLGVSKEGSSCTMQIAHHASHCDSRFNLASTPHPLFQLPPFTSFPFCFQVLVLSTKFWKDGKGTWNRESSIKCYRLFTGRRKYTGLARPVPAFLFILIGLRGLGYPVCLTLLIPASTGLSRPVFPLITGRPTRTEDICNKRNLRKIVSHKNKYQRTKNKSITS